MLSSVQWVHLNVGLVETLSMEVHANVEILVKEHLAAVTMHIHVGELLGAEIAEEIAVSVQIQWEDLRVL